MMQQERLILQMGMGVDAAGDVAAASVRALDDALSRAVIHLADPAEQVRVRIGVPNVGAQDAVRARLVERLPDAEVLVVPGGLSSGAAVVATAAVERFVPVRAGRA